MQRSDRSAMLRDMPMGRLVPKVSLPIMASMLVQAMYNVVDSVYVSRHDPNELTGVSLAYPIQMLMIALSVGMGIGINSLISRQLGAGERENARRTAWNGIFIELAGALMFFIVGATLTKAFMGVLVSDTLNDAALIRDMGSTYLSIVTMGSLGVFMAVCLERMLQSTGNTVMSMVTQMSGAVTNIVLDPLLIFGTPALGIPEMGVAGAAAATVIGQWVSMIEKQRALPALFGVPRGRAHPAGHRGRGPAQHRHAGHRLGDEYRHERDTVLLPGAGQ